MYHNRRLVAMVPIKEHSERIPGKNFRNFGDKPLYHHILHTLCEVAGIDEIIVDTDSERVIDEAPSFDDRIVIHRRSAELCGDHVSVNLLLKAVLAAHEGDLFLQTHATNPLLSPATIKEAIQAFLAQEENGFDSLFGVTRHQARFYDEHYNAVNHRPSELLRTQDLPPLFEENSLLYVFTRHGFAANGARIGRRPYLFETPPMESIDIDADFHFRVAELIVLYGGRA